MKTTQKKAQHTPWRLKLRERPDDGFTVVDKDEKTMFDDGSACGEYSQECTIETAAFIVRAVNSHEALLRAVHDAKEYVENILESSGEDNGETSIFMLFGKAIAQAEAQP